MQPHQSEGKSKSLRLGGMLETQKMRLDQCQKDNLVFGDAPGRRNRPARAEGLVHAGEKGQVRGGSNSGRLRLHI